ncbi:hypothetical protein EVAR_93620_1 [Eumeta japonica]|uniref:Uncharacterized protein n=1 Tax=Eumeta variegata TaxID=151549 RepID=A0A4C1TQI2_EUMVA|nr:hypothetical protein EVAR_93620_1 [Eumeta japonica]
MLRAMGSISHLSEKYAYTPDITMIDTPNKQLRVTSNPDVPEYSKEKFPPPQSHSPSIRDSTSTQEAGNVLVIPLGILSIPCCVKRLTLPWRGCESTVALNVQRSWGGGIERDMARVNAWHSNASA